MINKHKILQEYIQEFLEDNHLNFDAITNYAGYKAITPTYGDYLIKKDILGAKYKEYTFAFVGIEYYSTDESDINTSNMEVYDKFIEWIEEQERKHNYPDFGENTSEYKIQPLQNMANVSMRDDTTGTAKYMLACQIMYKEE